jgi:drug/metabolite transporter (DMT)-like permease
MVSVEQQRRRARVDPGYSLALLSGALWGVGVVVWGIALTMAPYAGASRWVVAPLVAGTLSEGLRGVWQVGLIAVRREWHEFSPLFHGGAGTLDTVLATLIGGPFSASCMYLSIAFAGVAYSATITAASPVFAALVGWIFLKDRLTAVSWGGIILTVAGAVTVSYRPPAQASPHFYLGVAFALLAALGWAFEGLFSKRALRHVGVGAFSAVRQVGSFVVMAVALLPVVGGVGFFLGALGHPSTLVLFASAAAGSLAYLFYFVSVHRIGPGRALPLNLTNVMWAAVLGVLVVGETFSWQLAAGALLVIAGAFLVVRGEHGLKPADDVAELAQMR